MSNGRSNMMMTKVLLEISISLDGQIAGPDVDSKSPMGRGASGVPAFTRQPPRKRRSPDNIAAARMSWSGEAFSIPGIERRRRSGD
jgi:hypothetical protein